MSCCKKCDSMVNFPNKWDNGIEYDFGNGLFGMRFVGGITASAGASVTTVLANILGIDKIVNSGGFWTDNIELSNIRCWPLYATNGTTQWSGLMYSKGTNNLSLYTHDYYGRNNSPYDIWIVYTKIN